MPARYLKILRTFKEKKEETRDTDAAAANRPARAESGWVKEEAGSEKRQDWHRSGHSSSRCPLHHLARAPYPHSYTTHFTAQPFHAMEQLMCKDMMKLALRKNTGHSPLGNDLYFH